MHVLALAASTSRRSINRQLIRYAARLIEQEIAPGTTVEIPDLADYEMPIYSIDRENEGGIPAEARKFREQIGAADRVLLSFAEHNGLYTAAYKNLFDWTSRIDRKVYQDRPTAMLATSVGPRGGGNVLRTALELAPVFGNELRGHLSIPSFNDNFDPQAGRLTEPELDTRLRDVLAALMAEEAPNPST